MQDSIPSKRAKGVVEEIGGVVKGKIGHLIGNEQMELEGKVNELKGQAHQASAKAEGRAKGAAEELSGNLQNQVGHLLDNEQMQAEGKAKELLGQARQKIHK